MNQHQANLLTDLYNLMNDFPKGRAFDMQEWVENSKHKNINEEKALKCGTACCAAGWGALSLPSWRRKFIISTRESSLIPNEYVYEVISRKTNKEIDNTDFGIATTVFDYMFMPGSYSGGRITPKRVAKHIKEIINDHGYDLV